MMEEGSSNGHLARRERRVRKPKAPLPNSPSEKEDPLAKEEEEIESVSRAERTRRLIIAAVRVWELRQLPWR